MVNVKHLVSFLLLILFSSCACDHYLTEMNGLRSKRLYKKYLKRKVNPEKLNLKTTLLYKNIDYKYEEDTKVFSKIQDSVSLRKDIYLKFFENGTYYIFRKEKGEKLYKQDLNPQKGNFSYVIKKNKKNVLMFYSTVNCGGFSRKDYRIKGDTLMISAGSNKGYRTWYYYTKKEIPKEWLDWEPDIDI